ncbi:MAG: SH3 domain-containing protein [Bauldia sp.]|nr:SH3 domain-containing protein [Bauldia sp.]
MSAPAEPVSAAFPDIGEYVDLVTELEEILRGAAAESNPVEADQPDAAAPVAEVAVPADEGIAPPALRPAPLRERARAPIPDDRLGLAPAAGEDGDPDPGFWQVDDAAWASAPAWREAPRGRRADLFIIGALVVLIAGGGAYSALRIGDGGAATAGDGIAAEASRAETGIGVPFAPIGRASLLRDDPTAPLPSLEAAVAGAEVPPLPVIIEAPVEATQPIVLAEAAEADPAPAATATAPVPAPAGLGGPLVPVDPAEAEAGVAVTRVTTVTTWVNMRAGPDNAEPVVVVVSPDTPVSVHACDYWCRVTVNGQDGYIFRDFLVALP